MLKNFKFPLLYLAEVLLFVPMLAGFAGVMAFWAATPLDKLDLHGKSLPANWEAAIPNHGKYLPGYLVASHPIAFALVVLLLIGSAVALHRVRKAQELLRKEASVSAVAHKIAQGSVFAAWVVTTYLLVMRVLVGVSPA